tara:strand:+ start:200 stop:373 length:174 start_codon:yes stop_codon:yes gene_type:complete
MANYTVTDFLTSEDTVVQVLAAMETQLETLDSTTNPIRLIKIEPLPDGTFVGVIMYD